ncbi:MAG: hypothetical protein ACOX1P_06100 [Thermoguttaceae bacterium]
MRSGWAILKAASKASSRKAGFSLRAELLEGRLPPIDRQGIIALIAPRPILDLSALNDSNGLV